MAGKFAGGEYRKDSNVAPNIVDHIVRRQPGVKKLKNLLPPQSHLGLAQHAHMLRRTSVEAALDHAQPHSHNATSGFRPLKVPSSKCAAKAQGPDRANNQGVGGNSIQKAHHDPYSFGRRPASRPTKRSAATKPST